MYSPSSNAPRGRRLGEAHRFAAHSRDRSAPLGTITGDPGTRTAPASNTVRFTVNVPGMPSPPVLCATPTSYSNIRPAVRSGFPAPEPPGYFFVNVNRPFP